MTGPPGRAEALACVPVPHPLARAQPLEDGGLLLSYEVRVRPLFSRLFQRFSGRQDDILTRRLELDALGAQVWDLMDGRRTVREIVELFAASHSLGRREAEVAVTRFLRDLGRRGLVAMRDRRRETGSR